jgi:hypothetical protein
VWLLLLLLPPMLLLLLLALAGSLSSVPSRHSISTPISTPSAAAAWPCKS